MKKFLFFFLSLCLLLTGVKRLWAQENIYLQRYSFLSAAAPMDSTSLLLNPAGIGFLKAVEMRLFYTSAAERDNSLTGSGGTLLFATPLLGGLNFGTALSLLKDMNNDNYLKSSFALSYSVRKILSFGIALRSFASNTSRDISGLFLVDAGLVSMPSDFFSLGFLVSNVNRPSFMQSPVGRKYRVSAALQPFGSGLTLTADLEKGEGDDSLSPSTSLKWEFLRGVEIAAGAIWKKNADRWEFFTGGMLEFKFGYFALSGGMERGSNSAISTIIGARFSSDRTSSVSEGDNLLVSVYLPSGAPEDPRVPFPQIRSETFYDFMFRLYRVYKDPRVKGVILFLENGSLGWAQAEEINRAIKKLNRAGKSVFVYIPSPGMKEYLAALPAKAIFVSESGILSLGGTYITLTYISELLQKIGVEAQFFPIGKYKNYPEIFNRTSPSPESLEMVKTLTNFRASFFEAEIKARKGLKKELQDLLSGSPYSPTQGIAEGLIDGYCPWNKVVDKILVANPGKYRYHPDYWKIKRRDESFSQQKVIAVVAIEGDLIDGESAVIPLLGIKLTGSADIVRDLNAAADSPEVAAIILRFNSGGGMLSAAETVFHAVKDIAGRKPLAAVIGNTGASGAYYIASAANRLFLQESSITGSIGVWGGKFSIKGLYEKLGIHRKTIKIGEHSDINSMDREYTPAEIEKTKEKLKYFYDLFIRRVKDGRRLETDAVENAAEGAVFTGRKALELKLADEVGGLFEVFEYLGGMLPDADRLGLKVYPEKRLMERLLEDLKSGKASSPSHLDTTAIVLKYLFNASEKPLVWMPFRID